MLVLVRHKDDEIYKLTLVDKQIHYQYRVYFANYDSIHRTLYNYCGISLPFNYLSPINCDRYLVHNQLSTVGEIYSYFIYVGNIHVEFVIHTT